MPDCPHCRTRIVRQAPRRAHRESLLRFLMIFPFRCQLCTHRFLAFRATPGYEPRREYERILVRYPVTFTSSVLGNQVGTTGGLMVDVSIRGCQIESAQPATQGACLRLEVVTAAGEPPMLVEAASIPWARDQRMGLQFLELRPKEERRLRRIIEHRLMARPL